jgi:hypothetical protein
VFRLPSRVRSDGDGLGLPPLAEEHHDGESEHRGEEDGHQFEAFTGSQHRVLQISQRASRARDHPARSLCAGRGECIEQAGLRSTKPLSCIRSQASGVGGGRRRGPPNKL